MTRPRNKVLMIVIHCSHYILSLRQGNNLLTHLGPHDVALLPITRPPAIHNIRVFMLSVTLRMNLLLKG
jgi:hypothetical protein